jgi:hypothetical protein
MCETSAKGKRIGAGRRHRRFKDCGGHLALRICRSHFCLASPFFATETLNHLRNGDGWERPKKMVPGRKLPNPQNRVRRIEEHLEEQNKLEGAEKQRQTSAHSQHTPTQHSCRRTLFQLVPISVVIETPYSIWYDFLVALDVPGAPKSDWQDPSSRPTSGKPKCLCSTMQYCAVLCSNLWL